MNEAVRSGRFVQSILEDLYRSAFGRPSDTICYEILSWAAPEVLRRLPVSHDDPEQLIEHLLDLSHEFDDLDK